MFASCRNREVAAVETPQLVLVLRGKSGQGGGLILDRGSPDKTEWSFRPGRAQGAGGFQLQM